MSYGQSTTRCPTTFADGVCDPQCDVEHAQFDGFDCATGHLMTSSFRSSVISVAGKSQQQQSYGGTTCSVSAANINGSQYAMISGSGSRLGSTSSVGRGQITSSSSSSSATSSGTISAIENKCRRAFGDGVCDNECDNAACVWDGGDCINKALR
jgi:LNR domain